MTSWLNTRPIIRRHISESLTKYPDYEITLVGHSLGGAVAALAGLEMRLKGWNPVVTTFGEPMIGNKAFATFLDEQFGMATPNAKHQRYRRVTHVDDPVPLLPLQEWGYMPHSGEIFISKSALPPSLHDVQICAGTQDPLCIAGSETHVLLRDMYRDVDIPLSVPDAHLEPCLMHQSASDYKAGQHVILGEEPDTDGVAGELVSCSSNEVTAPLYPARWDWSLIPARYRLWELFYAHRDYFWRIGLCVPGGDPTG